MQRLCLLERTRCRESLFVVTLICAVLTYQSWGTKGSDKASEDLGVVKSDEKNEVTVMVPTEQKDLNALYENEMRIINSKPPKEENKIAPEQKQEDYYKVSFYSPFTNPKGAVKLTCLEFPDERVVGLDHVECSLVCGHFVSRLIYMIYSAFGLF